MGKVVRSITKAVKSVVKGVGKVIGKVVGAVTQPFGFSPDIPDFGFDTQIGKNQQYKVY